MFKKLVKSTLALTLAIAGSAFAMQNPQGKITVGLTPAQTAAQKAEFAKMIEAKKAEAAAALKGKVAPIKSPVTQKAPTKVTPIVVPTKAPEVMQTTEAQKAALAAEIRKEKPAMEQAQSELEQAGQRFMKSQAPQTKLAPAAGHVWDPATGKWERIPTGYRYLPTQTQR